MVAGAATTPTVRRIEVKISSFTLLVVLFALVPSLILGIVVVGHVLQRVALLHESAATMMVLEIRVVLRRDVLALRLDVVHHSFGFGPIDPIGQWRYVLLAKVYILILLKQ